jgi:O-acetyl-ADP-ribose deacetylase (regulator of RNase III)
VWHGGTSGEAELLASAYRESLRLATDKGLKSISFPAISTGAYGYPLEPAARVALQTVIDFLSQNKSLEEVVFVLYDSATYQIYAETLRKLMPKTQSLR